ncbi:hypothetical protein JCM19239_1573 [Vibrio variabilis]|uniref:Uncharacterized protein n=1 Tax=Vibrio variabilis TaxID=990271 RepID=A0ABQ0JIA1_9VIBR|nr:hypothetical protein JCM19239_1573 [Vibrio variabilis]
MLTPITPISDTLTLPLAEALAMYWLKTFCHLLMFHRLITQQWMDTPFA